MIPSRQMITIVSDDMPFFREYESIRRNDVYSSLALQSTNITRTEAQRGQLSSKFYKIFEEFVCQRYGYLTENIDSTPSGKPTTGGVIAPLDGSWRYPSVEIHNNFDADGWKIFDPSDFG